MVFPDLSAPEVRPSQGQSKVAPIAFVADRMLALLLDFLIFSPVVSFFVAGLLRQTKILFLVDSQSAQGWLTAGFMFFFALVLMVFLQSVFLYFWQATPGQLFLQLRVVSFPVLRDKLTYPQCLVRATGWVFSSLFLGIPFFEVLSHPHRRAFHERASDTMVITLKKAPDVGPLPMESQFVSSWMRLSFLFVLLFFTALVMKSYHGLMVGGVSDMRAGAEQIYCKEVPATELFGSARLDAVISLYMLNAVTRECLDKEAEAHLWADPVNSQDLAYLAKYLVVTPHEQGDYAKKICEKSTTECEAIRYMQGESSLPAGEGASAMTFLSVLKLEEFYKQKKHTKSLELISSLEQMPVLTRALEKKFVRSAWALQQQENKKGRQPASADSEQWLELFKGRYQIK